MVLSMSRLKLKSQGSHLLVKNWARSRTRKRLVLTSRHLFFSPREELEEDGISLSWSTSIDIFGCFGFNFGDDASEQKRRLNDTRRFPESTKAELKIEKLQNAKSLQKKSQCDQSKAEKNSAQRTRKWPKREPIESFLPTSFPFGQNY